MIACLVNVTVTTIPDNFTGAVALVGNQTVAPNDTVTTSTQQQIHVEGCVVLKGQLNLTITSNAVVGKQPLITTANPCLTGQFSEFNYRMEDNPPICSAQLEYSTSSVVTNLLSCPPDDVQGPSFPFEAVVGGVVGGVVFLVMVILLLVFLVKPIHDCVMPNRNRAVDMDENENATRGKNTTQNDKQGKNETQNDKQSKPSRRKQTLGPDAVQNAVYDDQGRSGQNALYDGKV